VQSHFFGFLCGACGQAPMVFASRIADHDPPMYAGSCANVRDRFVSPRSFEPSYMLLFLKSFNALILITTFVL
jgi:hypothetical protein